MAKIQNLKREFVIKEDHDYFNNCHASTIASLPNGDIIVAYFAGTKEGSSDTAIWISKKTSGRWKKPKRTFYHAGIPHWNPVLHLDGDKVYLFYKAGSTVHNWKTRVAVSDDYGETWTKSKELVEGDKFPRGPVKNKLLVLSNGAWLAPGSVEVDFSWDAFIDYSFDNGLTWEKYDVPFEHKTFRKLNKDDIWEGLEENLWANEVNKVSEWDGVIQPTLWESENGRVHMFLRSTRGKIYRSDSHDYGKTWCKAYPTSLPNNNSGIDVVKLDNGNLALVYNPVSGNWSKRTPISIRFSEDNGITWAEPFHLEKGAGEFSYPAIISYGNVIQVTYTWKRKNIIYHSITI